MSGRRVARAAAIGGLAALLPLLWYFVAPPQLGGRTSYVTTAGSSMEPRVHRGDLVVVRANPSYEVGDVVAYRNPQVGGVLLHRIVGLDGDRYLLKGDANSWLDGYHPTREDVLGEMVVRVPGLGARLGSVRTPAGAVAITGLASIGILGGRRRVRKHRRLAEMTREEGVSSRRAERDRTPRRRSDRPVAGGVVAASFGVIAVLAIASGGMAYALPPTVTSHRDIAYEQHGSFTYAGQVPDQGHPVYGGETIETGDPVYLKLTSSIQVGFDYDIETDAAFTGRGTIGMVVQVSDVDGWARTFEIGEPTAFTGGVAHVTGTLDLRRFHVLTAQLERVTGVERDHYTVAVRPEVSISGTLAGHELSKSFTPELRFFLDPLELQLERDGMAPPGEEVVDPLEPTAGGLLATTVTQPRTFGLLGVEVGLEPLRVACLAGLLVALIGMFVVVFGRFRSAREGEPALIAARYGQWLVPVGPSSISLGRTVAVDSIDSLMRLAHHYGHVVLHEQAGGHHAYSVEENGVTYRYLVANGKRP